ncbi:MAG TPA: hypothetical protein VG795_01315 [Acidimicrobiia bacterium]|nr:hypothetical protein [Acidimicrobiia bacterium]
MSEQERTAGTPDIPLMIRGACIVLMILGVSGALFSLQVVVDPAGARCGLSRTWIDAVNHEKDKKEWNNVDTGGKKGEDLACADAIPLADAIRIDEKDPSKTATVPGDSVLRMQYGVSLIVGAVQAGSGFAVLRTRSRRARNYALGSSAAGLLIPVGFIVQILGIFSILIFVFLGYAFAFSAPSRELWPREAPRG